MDKNYWMLYLRMSEVNINRIRVGEEVDIPRHVGGTDTHKLLEENYDAASVGDLLIISSFARETKAIALGEIIAKDDKFIKIKKTRDLFDPVNHEKFESDEIVKETGYLSEIGTLKKIDQDIYDHMVENIISLDNLDDRS